jgi:seryl-tRNA synthetase
MPTYDMRAFYEGLVAHGLIIPSAILGTFGRGPVFEDVLERLDQIILSFADADGAERLHFPPVIDRSIIERTGYYESFPHLIGAVHSFCGKELQARQLAEKAKSGEPYADMLDITDVALAPAACYPVYPTYRGKLPPGGKLVTLIGWAYRHEPSEEPTRMQAFRVREYVRLGGADEVVQWRDTWLERGLQILRDLQLPMKADVAADPFFGRAGKMLAAGQIEQKLKFEVLIPIISEENPTAVCSFNYHQDKFASAFDIKTPDGETAHTACLGFGMERFAMALFKHHGFEPKEWPAEVRARLWP